MSTFLASAHLLFFDHPLAHHLVDGRFHKRCRDGLAIVVTPTAVSGAWDQSIRAWALEDGVEISAFIGESTMSSCAISPDGRVIVAGEESGQLHILRLEGV